MLLDKIEQLSEGIVEIFQEEFIEQGHDASGQGVASIHAQAQPTSSGFKILIKGNKYLKYVNQRRKAGIMPPIQALKEWVRIRNIAQGNDVDRAAWAIGMAIKREGSPTAGAYNHTNNGRRIGFIEQSAKESIGIINKIRSAIIKGQAQEINKVVMNGVN